MADDGSLGALCDRLGIELLAAHGNAVRDTTLSPPRDLDLAFRTRQGVRTDIVSIINAFIDATRYDGVDLMDIARR
ncbi:hypothetical protein [Solicola gregarius]|uniref:Uncharacterized protein n=1 Tax=Solicola gregarius TaxID=2908642 RepID=A0AA46TFL6_9ACTN|nr:hypothetical protein [Solicola gregarius]UYM04345.1 hypothetical protein L0C25_17645 [Solicola gregarius]